MVCGMINLYDSNANNNQIIRRDEINNIAKKNEGISEAELSERVNWRTVCPSLLITENQVSVLIKEYFRTDNRMIQIGDPIARRYPLQRVILGYEHNLSQGYSYPVQKLYVHIDDIEYANQQGDIVLDDEYIDEKSKIKHQERVVNKYEMDDKHLQARQLSEIFITTENGEEVIDEAKVREGEPFVGYQEIEPNKWKRPNGTIFTKNDEKSYALMLFNPKQIVSYTNSKEFNGRKETVFTNDDEEYFYESKKETFKDEEWKRPDGTPFVKRTEDWERVAKPKSPGHVTLDEVKYMIIENWITFVFIKNPLPRVSNYPIVPYSIFQIFKK